MATRTVGRTGKGRLKLEEFLPNNRSQIQRKLWVADTGPSSRVFHLVIGRKDSEGETAACMTLDLPQAVALAEELIEWIGKATDE